MESQPPRPADLLPPLPYQKKLLDYLKREERALWEWFSSEKFKEDYARNVRLELLKTAYRLERPAHAPLYAVADRAAAGLRLEVPVTVYQSQGGQGMNAALAFVPGEIHVVFTGPVAARLSGEEVLSVLSHEFSHYLLWDGWDGEFLVADQILTAMANHERGKPCHFQSARLFRLYTELFADRGSLFVTGNPGVTISGLVKLQTGIEVVSAESYLRQAEEIFSKEAVKADELTHPETYIRARALRLWADRGEEAQAEIARMIEGPLELESLDLVRQEKLSGLTRRLMALLLLPRWFRSAPVLAHARLFFEDFVPPVEPYADEALFDEIKACGAPVRDYLCYLLLDFVAADPDLEEVPLAAAHALADRLDLADRLEELAVKELGLPKKRVAALRKDRDKILASAGSVDKRAPHDYQHLEP